MEFFGTFRGRLLVILAIVIVATLGVQYYVNLLTQAENERQREIQEQIIFAGFALGLNGITSSDYLLDLINVPGQTFLNEEARKRIRDIIIINNDWQITDSLTPELLPTEGADGTKVFKTVADLAHLPPLSEGERLGEDLKRFPQGATTNNVVTEEESHPIPIETSEGRWYILVVLRNDKGEVARRAARPLLATFGILFFSTLLTIVFVWRFTRPIANLSNAARAVAAGDLAVRVQQTERSDEISQLARNFNEMAAELEKKQELEAQLQQAEKSAVIGRLGSAIAHEIRNPLNYINLTLDHLRSKFAPPEADRRQTFDKLTLQLKSEVARINGQITDFLSYSRPASLDLQAVDARAAVEDSVRIVEGQAAEMGIKISVVEHEDVKPINADPEYLRSLFNNLFINAVQAMGNGGGNLNIRILPDGEGVKFEISDTGSGIPKENLVKIFEPYFSTKDTGTGLGLAIVQKIVESHSGTIEAESTEGEGTKFTVRLPGAV